MLIKKYLVDLDQVGPRVNLHYKESPIVKTPLGSIVTLAIFIFFLYSVVYFGSDIIYKEKPISRFSKEYKNDSRIYLKDYPMKIQVSTLAAETIQPKDFATFMNFTGTLRYLGVEVDKY